MKKKISNLFKSTNNDSGLTETLLAYPASDTDQGDIIDNATVVSKSLDHHPKAEAGAQNTATSFANTRSSISTLTSSIKKVAVAATSSLTKTKQLKEEPPLEGYRPASTITTQNQELAFDLACRKGDIENFNKIIDQNPDIIKIKCNGNFPLITALKNKHSEIATALIEKGADPDPQNDGAPLQKACENGDRETVKALIDKQVNLDIATKGGITGIIAACINNHPKVVGQLIDAGADLNKATTDEKTAIIFACINNHPEIVRQLIDAGADLNIGLAPGKTLLQVVCGYGYSEVVKVFIEEKPELLHQAHDSEPNPLRLAIENSHGETVEQLINAGIHLNEEVLLYGLSSEFADLFITKVDVNQPTKDGKTLLCIACEDQNDYLVELLIQKGARIDQVTKDGRAPIDIACQTCNTEIVQMLFDAGANVNPEITKELKYEDKKSELTERYFKYEDKKSELTERYFENFIILIKKLGTKESIEERDKKLENKRQPSSDVTLAGASSASRQEVGARSPG